MLPVPQLFVSRMPVAKPRAPPSRVRIDMRRGIVEALLAAA